MGSFFFDLVEWYRELLKEDPSSQVFVRLAEALYAEEQWEEAAEVCRKGLTFYPEHLAARVVLGLSLWQMDDPAGARHELEHAQKELERNALLYKVLARIAWEDGLSGKALRHLALYLILQPRDQEAREWLAEWKRKRTPRPQPQDKPDASPVAAEKVADAMEPSPEPTAAAPDRITASGRPEQPAAETTQAAPDVALDAPPGAVSLDEPEATPPAAPKPVPLTAPEAPPDTPHRIAPEAAREAASETGPEALPLTAPEPSPPAAPEAVSDTEAESSPLSEPEAVLETVPEPETEAAPEPVAHMAPEAALQTAPEAAAPSIAEPAPQFTSELTGDAAAEAARPPQRLSPGKRTLYFMAVWYRQLTQRTLPANEPGPLFSPEDRLLLGRLLSSPPVRPPADHG